MFVMCLLYVCCTNLNSSLIIETPKDLIYRVLCEHKFIISFSISVSVRVSICISINIRYRVRVVRVRVSNDPQKTL